MSKMIRVLSGAVLSLAALLLKALGGWDAALALMLGMMGLDVASGLLVSFQRRSAKTAQGGFLSGQLFLGLTRKLLMLLMVMLGTALDGLLGTSLCRLTVIGFYAANEAFSVIENAALLGLPFPRGLLQALERYREKMDGAFEKEGDDKGGSV